MWVTVTNNPITHKFILNLFVLHKHPQIAAQMHCDKHVCKMCVESVQILCSVYHISASQLEIPYKLSHKNHPCCIWARYSRANFEWLLQHSGALCEEYTERYGKYHKSQAVLEWCEKNKDSLIFTNNGLSPFAVAIGTDKLCRKHPDFDKIDTVHNYRLYYVMDKPFAKWKNGNIPEWFVDMKQECAKLEFV